MQINLPCVVLAMVCNQTPQEEFRTANFLVQADSAEVAKLVAESAEKCRQKLAKLWLGKEPAPWDVPCPIQVSLTMSRVGGFTNVAFSHGKVHSQTVNIEGPLDRILKGPLPHELAHVLLANKFGFRPPRWADEGVAILSEDKAQGERQVRAFRKIYAEDRCFALRRLLEMQDYPADVPCLYAQGHSVARYLVTAKGRKVFLDFLKDGHDRGWDTAAEAQYGFKDVEQLETAWLGWVEKHAVSADAGRSQGKMGANVSEFGSVTDLGLLHFSGRKAGLSLYLDIGSIP
jgi:hypothetical protein